MSDVFDDVEGIRLPDYMGDFDVLLHRHMNLLDDFVGLVYWDRNLLDDFYWYFLYYRHGDPLLDLNVLSFVHRIRHLFDDVYWDLVRLGNWYSNFLPDWYRNGLGHSHLDVADDFNGNSSDDVLDYRLQLVL